MTDLAELRQAADRATVRLAYDDARSAYETLRAALAARFGEGHTSVEQIDAALGGVARARGDYAAARAAFERAGSASRARGDAAATSYETLLAHLDPLDPAILAARPRLLIEHAGRAPTWVANDIFFIGRGIERVHLFIPSAMLSRVHARVLWRDSAWLIEDCSSENGTLHEGARIDIRAIADGDVYGLGAADVTIRFAVR